MSDLTHSNGCLAALSGADQRATEVYSWQDDDLQQLSHQNDSLFAQLRLARTEDVGFRSADGTEVYTAGERVPLLLRIHGGPDGQDQHDFSFERQIFAANGYAVLNVNYRGSSGRGQKFQRAIFADWGHYDVEDLEAGINHVIAMGIADPKHLGGAAGAMAAS